MEDLLKRIYEVEKYADLEQNEKTILSEMYHDHILSDKERDRLFYLLYEDARCRPDTSVDSTIDDVFEVDSLNDLSQLDAIKKLEKEGYIRIWCNQKVKQNEEICKK